MPSRQKRILVPHKTPRLFVSARSRTPRTFGLGRKYPFRYAAKVHAEVPHVVKFSGGRSSGMLLFVLLESGLLQRERGDVVVFNNTSAEHPETYQFVSLCKSIVEEHYGIPFFWLEFQTYEDARNGEWTRLPSYRLVKPKPCARQKSSRWLLRERRDLRGDAFLGRVCPEPVPEDVYQKSQVEGDEIISSGLVRLQGRDRAPGPSRRGKSPG